MGEETDLNAWYNQIMGVTLPQAKTVPKKRITPDPGVRAPLQSFESTAGILADELLPLSQALTEVAIRQQNRRETVARSEAINTKRKDNAELLEKFRVERDLSIESELKEFGEIMSGRRQDVLRDADMTDGSREIMGARLLDIDSEFTAKAAAISTRIGREKVVATWEDRLKPRLESLRADPSDENLRVQIASIPGDIDDLRGVWEPGEEAQREQQAASLYAHQALNTLLDTDRIDEAEVRFSGITEEGQEGEFKASDLVTVNEQAIMGRRIAQARQQKIKADAALDNAEELARRTRAGFLQANRDVINQMFADAGINTITSGPNGEPNPIITSPFGGDAPVGPDTQQMMEHLLMARRFLAGGMTSQASGHLQAANTLAKLSPEILRNRELDKPLTIESAGELGVELDSTLRQFLATARGTGFVPRSPEEIARSRSRATAQGAGEVKAGQQIAFFRDGATVITDLLSEIEADPTIVGLGGSFRSVGKNVVGILTDLGADALVDKAKSIVFEESEASLDEIEGWFDPDTLDVLGILENSIGIIFARSRFGTGRLPVDVIKTSISDVGLTGFKSSDRVSNRLRFVLQRLEARIGSLEKQFDLVPAGPDLQIPVFNPEGGTLVLEESL